MDMQYDKLITFVTGKCKLLRAYRSFAPEQYRPLVDQIVHEREFELMYVQGRDREQRKPPYREILRKMPFAYRAKNAFKCLFPGLQKLYRQRKGYTDR